MYHLIATKTVLPTLKSARDYCSQPRPPQFLLSSDDPAECIAYGKKLGGANRIYHDDAALMNGLPLFVTPDWTYFLVRQD